MQYLKQDGRENDVSILLALALLDPDEHPVTIDIGELERYDLRGSQAGGISQAQDRPVLGVRRRGDDENRCRNTPTASGASSTTKMLTLKMRLQRPSDVYEADGSRTRWIR